MPYTRQAETLIRNTGARITGTRVRVLALLLRQSHPMSHHEIEHNLDRKDPIDRVTLYRVLDWLVESELAHKLVGDDQIWRFAADGEQATHQHAHFQCTKCGAITCFTELTLPSNIALPAGFRGHEFNFMIKGTCPRCS